MTNEERDLIARFVSRVGGAPQSGGFLPGQGGSVPQSQPQLPPIDHEADSFIADQLQRYPEARYRITQMAVVQEAALAEMNNRLTQMQWQLEQARQQQQAQPQPQQSHGLFGGLFGGGAAQQQPQPRSNPWGNAGAPQPGYGGPQYAPPPPQYAPGYRPGMFGGGGSGFLGSALTTAAGVAGGMVVGNALMNAFSGHHDMGEAVAAPLGGAGGFLGGTDPGTNAFDGSGIVPAADPTAGFGGDSFGGGGTGFDDPGTASDAGFDSGGFDDASGGGFDSGGFDNT
jgi:hypothetical protein